MSKTYRRTVNNRKIDWLPPYHFRDPHEIQDSEEELEKFIRETKVYKEKRYYTYTNRRTGEKEIGSYIFRVNLYELQRATNYLNCLQWWKNNPHRKADNDDHFKISYAKNPGWWNHITYTKKRRASDRNIIHKIKCGKLDPEEAIFYDKKKPVIYYW